MHAAARSTRRVKRPELTAVDLFAGAGGFTIGAQEAGVRVLWAANHWPIAVQTHAANHPDVDHSCQDLRQADFGALPRYDILLASPACQGNSEAGRRWDNERVRAKHDADRATAWAVVDCLEKTKPRGFLVENIPFFKRWALFPVWLQALEVLGYKVQVQDVLATDVGVPQSRRRTIVSGLRDRAHQPLKLQKTPAPPVWAILDPDAIGWEPVTAKPDGVQRRVAKGRRNWGRTFLTQHVTNHPGRPLDGPIATITTASCHWHLVDGPRIRPLTIRELARGQSFPDSYLFPEEVTLATRLIGNAIPRLKARAAVRALVGAL